MVKPKPCERCERAGDLACIQLRDEDGNTKFELALHKNGTIEVADESEPALLHLLAYVQKVWLETTVAVVMLPAIQSKVPSQDYVNLVEAGFLKLRYYGTMDGALRERMRAAGMSLPDDSPAFTQAAGKA